jgi:hypothetical protein
MLGEGNGPLAGLCGLGLARIVVAQEVHQGGSQLLRGAPRPLAFEGVPIAIADGKAPLQLFCQALAVFRPLAGGIHWTQACFWSHPGLGSGRALIARL